jgi:hypothetical protein
VSFALVSGRVCLQEWDEPLLVDHVVGLLLDLREARRTRTERPILVLVVNAASLASSSAQDVIPTAMHAILDGCAELLVVADPIDARSSVVRSLLTKTAAHGRTPPQLFRSLDEALRYAQGVAPHDVLELQRQNLQRSSPPRGHQ